jgi:RNA polymerase sigma-70 factor (ECF subfamily)
VIYTRTDSFQGRGTFRSWVYGITLRTARSQKRKNLLGRWTRFLLDNEDFVDTTKGPEQIEAQEALTVVQSILDGMPHKLREVFVLAEIEGLTGSEIAEAQGCSRKTVVSRLRLARKSFERGRQRHEARESFWVGP